MTHEEYIDLFHKAQVNLVAFKPVFNCNEELRHMVEMAVEAEREACAKVCEKHSEVYASLPKTLTTDTSWAACIDIRDAIRARGNT